MGISRCPVREMALEESHKKTSSIAARSCLSACVCVTERGREGSHTCTCAPVCLHSGCDSGSKWIHPHEHSASS